MAYLILGAAHEVYSWSSTTRKPHMMDRPRIADRQTFLDVAITLAHRQHATEQTMLIRAARVAALAVPHLTIVRAFLGTARVDQALPRGVLEHQPGRAAGRLR